MFYCDILTLEEAKAQQEREYYEIVQEEIENYS